jgi:hypothetical protein
MKDHKVNRRGPRTVPRRRFCQAAAAAMAGWFGVRTTAASATPRANDAEREAEYYRPLFERGKDLAG